MSNTGHYYHLINTLARAKEHHPERVPGLKKQLAQYFKDRAEENEMYNHTAAYYERTFNRPPPRTEQVFPSGEEGFRCRNCGKLIRVQANRGYCYPCMAEDQDWAC